MKLDKRSNVPLYAQLKELLADRMDQGVWQKGQQIPSELALCEELDLSRPTVRQAIAELVSEGRLVIQKGRGTYVSAEPDRIELRGYTAFYFSILSARSISDLPIESIEQIVATPEIERVFQSPAGDPKAQFWKISYLLDMDHSPYADVTVTIPVLMFPDLGPDIKAGKRMVDITANKYAFLPQKAQGSLLVRPSSVDEAKRLELSRGTPVLVHTAKLISRSGGVCEWVNAVLRPDMVDLGLESGRS